MTLFPANGIVPVGRLSCISRHSNFDNTTYLHSGLLNLWGFVIEEEITRQDKPSLVPSMDTTPPFV